jgi:hypothetical protein
VARHTLIDLQEHIVASRAAHDQLVRDMRDLGKLVSFGYEPTAEDVAYLEALAGLKKIKKRGRPRGGFDSPAYWLKATVAVVKRLKEYFRERGVKYRTHELAIDAALEFMAQQGRPVPPREKLEHALKRSRKPRR